MKNYFFILFVLLMSCDISASAPNQQPPYITIVDALGTLISDQECFKEAKESISKEFQKLLVEQKDKASRIQQMLNSSEPTKSLFIEWKSLEDKKTKIVTDNLNKILNCSGLFRAGKRIAAVPGQIARGAQEVAQATASAARTTATAAAVVPLVIYKAGAGAVTATVDVAEQAGRTVQKKVNETQEAIVAQKDSYLQSLIKWIQGGLSKKIQPAMQQKK